MAGIADAQSIEMASLQKLTHLTATLNEFLSSSDSEDYELLNIAAIIGDCCSGKEHPQVLNFVEKCSNTVMHYAPNVNNSLEVYSCVCMSCDLESQ